MEITAAKKRLQQSLRAKRTRAHLAAGSRLPRLSVFRSGRHIYAQIIDDALGKTLVSARDAAPKNAKKKISPLGRAAEVGEAIAQKAREQKIQAVIFDRGGYLYHGRVRALAEGARKGGLTF